MTTKKQQSPIATGAFTLGQNYFVRAVTHYYTGKLVELTEHELVLEDAAWIADTGRFSDAMQSGEFSEVEPYPDGVKVLVMRGAVVDASEWRHALPRSRK